MSSQTFATDTSGRTPVQWAHSTSEVNQALTQ